MVAGERDWVHFDVPERFNLAAAVIDANVEQGRGNKIALCYKDYKLTYKDVQRMVNRAGNALKSVGIDWENRVAILLPDCPEWIATFFGAMKIGAVPVPFNTMLQPHELEYLLNDSRAKAIIVSDALVEQIRQIKVNLKYLKHVVVLGEAKGDELSYEALVKEASPELEAANTSKDDVALWWYTSGTTGFPKGTVHLHHDLVHMPEAVNKLIYGMTENDVVFAVPRLFFAFSTIEMVSSLWIGAAHILMPERPLPENVLEIITKHKPTVFFGVPTFFAHLLELKDIEQYDLSSIRICGSGGEHLPADIYHRFKERFGIEILDLIGTTEAGNLFICSRPGRVRPGSTGEVVPGIEVRLVDEEGNEVPVGEDGRLMIKSDSVAPYYWNKHDKTKEVINGDWLCTGDIFCRDEDGYYWFKGRVDDMIKAGGIWVSPPEVEATLVQHPAVVESAVVGATDEEGLVKPKAFVVLSDGYKPSPELVKELQNFVKSKVAPYKYPRWVEFVPELPKTATGKIQRFKLR